MRGQGSPRLEGVVVVVIDMAESVRIRRQGGVSDPQLKVVILRAAFSESRYGFTFWKGTLFGRSCEVGYRFKGNNRSRTG